MLMFMGNIMSLPGQEPRYSAPSLLNESYPLCLKLLQRDLKF